jgi:hypothetical protein
MSDHLYTTSAAERDAAVAQYGYVAEGITGYVQATPVFYDNLYTTSVAEIDQAVQDFYIGAVTVAYILTGPNLIDHLYTTSTVERDSAVSQYAYTLEGTVGYVFDAQQPGTNALYRLSRQGQHLYTTSAPERDQAVQIYGYSLEGITGYVFDAQQPGSDPLFRLSRASDGDHLYTTSAAERDAAVAQYGYVAEGITGYVLVAQQAGTSPLFRLSRPATEPLFRLNSPRGQHLYTTSALERDQAVQTYHYTFEGITGYLYPGQVPGTLPLFRLSFEGIHLYVTDKAQRDNAIAYGWTDEGITGYVFSAAAPGTAPLQGVNRFWNIPLFRLSHNGHHLYTASAIERDLAVQKYGYTFEGIACYLLSILLQNLGAVVLFRMAGPDLDHLYTTSQIEVTQALQKYGYHEEQSPGYIFPAARPGVIPFYRLSKATVPNTVVVPNVVGKRLQDATQTLQQAGLQVGAVSGPAGFNLTVVSQSPNAGTRLFPGSSVDLTVAAATAGISSVKLYNSLSDNASVYVWLYDGATQQWTIQNNGNLLSEGQSTTFALQTGHVYTVEAVDPNWCGQNDPQNTDCIRWSQVFQGDSAGPSYTGNIT